MQPTSEIQNQLDAVLATVVDGCKVWMYLASRPLTDQEAARLSADAQTFTEQWAAHGTRLKAGHAILGNQIFLLYADERHHNASGCSIDSAVHWLQKTGEAMQIDFFNRLRIAWINPEGTISAASVNALEPEIANGNFSPFSLVFDLSLSSGADLQHRWLVPATQTWVQRFLPATAQ
jgi:hypothetical protein